MGSVKIVESVERVGDASVSTIEYEFSDSVDFLAWEADKVQRLNNAIKNYVGGLDGSEYGEPTTGEIWVNKKKAKETIH